jgi:hypothetical protein
MKPIIMKFSPLSCYLVPLRPKYSQTLSAYSSLNVSDQVSHPHKTKRKIIVLYFPHKENLNVTFSCHWFLHHKFRNTALLVLSISKLQKFKTHTIKSRYVCKSFQNLLLLVTKCKLNSDGSSYNCYT